MTDRHVLSVTHVSSKLIKTQEKLAMCALRNIALLPYNVSLEHLLSNERMEFYRKKVSYLITFNGNNCIYGGRFFKKLQLDNFAQKSLPE